MRSSDGSSDVCSSDLASGAGADDADRLAGRGADPRRLDPALGPGGIGDIFFDAADRHRAVAGEFDHAIAFAQSVLRADAAADLGHGRGCVRQLIGLAQPALGGRSEEHTSELQSLMRNSYAVFCLKKKNI